MKFLPCLQSLCKKFDLFSTSQFLRYQEEGDYKTASGGICSIMVVTVFVALFMNTAIQTINMDIINWSSSQQFLFDPQLTEVTIDPKGSHFMFAVGVMGVNLNNPTTRFFDVEMIERGYTRGGVPFKGDKVPMVPCTQEHFGINDEIQASFSTLPAKKWLCPPIGYSFKLYGKYTSARIELLEINIRKCNDTLDPSRPCVPDTTIQNMQTSMGGSFTYNIFYVNPLVNAGSKDYLSYYLEDRNYIAFSTQLGAYSNGFVQDYEIETDISLLPFSDNVYDKGIIIPDLFQTIPYQVNGDLYASYYLLKSSTSTSFLRSFNKLDSFFSYVGGLVGTILGFMLIVQSFTEMSFELDLSEKLFSHSENPPNRSFQHFNFLTYLKFRLYQVLNFFGCCKDWITMKQYQQCQTQIVKQLDISLLLHRVNFLERAMEVIFDQSQIYGLHLQKTETLKSVKQRRRRYGLKQQIQNAKVANQNQVEPTEKSDSSSDDSKNDKNEEQKRKGNSSQKLANSQIPERMGSLVLEDNLQTMKQQSKVADPSKKRRQLNQKQQLKKLKRQGQQGNSISRKIAAGLDSSYLQQSSEVQMGKQLKGEQPQQSISQNAMQPPLNYHQFQFLN